MRAQSKLVSFLLAVSLAFAPAFAAAEECIGDACAPESPAALAITLEAESASGAPVSQLSDDMGGPFDTETYSCTIDGAPVSTIPLGTSDVSCEVHDGDTPLDDFVFSVTVQDTTPPTITPPADESFATSTFPAYPTARATATDLVDSDVAITFEPSSFTATGTYEVIWTATDDAGKSATATSTVTVTEEPDEDAGSEGASGETPTEHLAITASLALPNGCSVTDSAGTTHFFPTATSTEYLAICAIAEAEALGIIDDFAATEFSGFGLFIDSVNGVSAEGAFWALYYNATSSDMGLTQLELAAGDEISLQLTTFAGEPVGDTVTLTVESLEDRYHNIMLPNACTVTDLAETVHAFSDAYLGICALDEAQREGYIDAYALVEFSGVGLFVDSINGVQDPASSYWALYHNDVYEETHGLISLPLAIGDTMSLVYTNFLTNATSTAHGVRVIALTDVVVEEAEAEEPQEPSSGGGGGGGGGTVKPTFNVPLALQYLSQQQSADGSFVSPSDPTIADWVALAFAAQDPGDAKTKLRQHFLTVTPTLSTVADYERHAMALMALGIDPYTGTSVNVIQSIVNGFDGTQIGLTNYDNDDTFALFPLLKAGYGASEKIITKTVAYLVSKQLANGSWENSVDFTAATVQALSLTPSLPGVSSALTQAETYLRSQQHGNGGFGNSFSTSWALQGIAALGQSPTQWMHSGNTPLDHLASVQQSDGGVDAASVAAATRVWATSSAIPGALGRTWPSLLQSFAKPTTAPTAAGGTAATTTATSTVTTSATTTPETTVASSSPATTTAFVASSTPLAEIPTDVIALAARITDTLQPRRTTVTPVQHIETSTSSNETIDETATSSETSSNQLAAAAGAADANWWLIFLVVLALLLAGFGLHRFLRRR